MGGVDTLDAYLAYYRIYIRSKKYYLRLFFHLLDLTVVNNWLHYRRDCESLAIPRQKQKDQLAFKLALAYHLCKHGKRIAGEKREDHHSMFNSSTQAKREEVLLLRFQTSTFVEIKLAICL